MAQGTEFYSCHPTSVKSYTRNLLFEFFSHSLNFSVTILSMFHFIPNSKCAFFEVIAQHC